MIYKITNTYTNDFYIGYSKDPQKRFEKHKWNAKYGSDTYLYKAMRKYGSENFTLSLLEACTLDESCDKEKEWIAKLKPQYNMTDGGDGGNTSNSPRWKEGMKHRRSYAGDGNPMFGKSGFGNKKHSESSKAKQSESTKDVWSKADRKARGSKVSGEKNGMFGKTPPNSSRIEFEGVIYNSIAAASRTTGRCSKYLKKNGTII